MEDHRASGSSLTCPTRHLRTIRSDQRSRERFGDLAGLLLGVRLDHDPDQRLGAARAHEDPALPAKLRLRLFRRRFGFGAQLLFVRELVMRLR